MFVIVTQYYYSYDDDCYLIVVTMVFNTNCTDAFVAVLAILAPTLPLNAKVPLSAPTFQQLTLARGPTTPQRPELY